MGILLFLAAVILAVSLLPFGFLWGLVHAFYHHHFNTGFKTANAKLILMATLIDIYGNVVCAELFNDLLITKDSTHYFGNSKETISIVLGYNLLFGTISRSGLFLSNLLDVFQCHHCYKAIGFDFFPYISRWIRIKKLLKQTIFNPYP